MTYTPVGWADDETHPMSQANMKTLDAGLADIHGRAVQFIDSGSATGNFTIPDLGGFSRLRLTLSRATLSATGQIAVRVNDDSTTGLHQTGMIVRRASDGAVTDTIHDDLSAWRLSEWATTAGNFCIVDIVNTAGSGIVAYRSWGGRHSGDPTAHRHSEGWGRLTATRTLTSLRVIAVSPVSISGLDFIIEGVPA